MPEVIGKSVGWLDRDKRRANRASVPIDTEGTARFVRIMQNPAEVARPACSTTKVPSSADTPDADSPEESGPGALESPPPSEQPESGAA